MVKKLTKKLLRFIPPSTVLPMFGPNFGKKWVFGAANIRNWLSLDEKNVQRAFKKHIKKGWVVYDVGAHVGFYTLLASSLVGPEGKVHAFEPLAKNFDHLLKHLRINKVQNALPHRLAVSDKSGIMDFEEGTSTSTSHLVVGGKIQVEAVSIDEFIKTQSVPLPDFLKIDVEGHELQVLKGMSRLLNQKRDVIIHLEANSGRQDIFDFLKEYGYSIERLDGDNILAIR